MNTKAKKPWMNGYTWCALGLWVFYYLLAFIGYPAQDWTSNLVLGFGIFLAPGIFAILSFFRPQRDFGGVISGVICFVIGGFSLIIIFALIFPQS
jgi:hypothetical protein